MGNKGLVILHIDGLGYHYLKKALCEGRMPFVQSLISDEGYEVLRYRCGIPSTTPFAQAGIMYGDNSEIPSFRWWDKQSGLWVTFGGLSTFKHVAHKYFQHCDPLIAGGAAIATCFPAAAAATYHLGYRSYNHDLHPFSQRRVIANWAMNPIHLLDWVRRGLVQVWKANVQYLRTSLAGRPVSRTYVISDMLEEILLHHLTRFAVLQAMQEGYPVIYGAFYAYDETSHAFGPGADYSFRILRHVDHTIQRIANGRSANGHQYEMVILSDHGQIETVPFARKFGHTLGQLVSEWLPTYAVEETKGIHYTPREAIDGHIALAYSGGLAHLYFKDISWRMDYAEMEERYPGLVGRMAGNSGIDFVLLREDGSNLIVSKDQRIRFEAGARLPASARDLLARFDDPDILAYQLQRLNSFQRSGDLILFGEYSEGQQINFEDQVGGHGSVGGEQLAPFVLAKSEWNFDTRQVKGATDLYPLLKRLKDRLVP
jgi:hypothetical protein